MRVVVVAVWVAFVVGGGCASMEEKRIKRADEFSASRLDGKFGAEDPIVQMLSPQERAALDNAGLMGEPLPPSDDEAAAEDGAVGIDGKPRSTSDQVGDALMSVLTVSVTVGMMVAPYLLF